MKYLKHIIAGLIIVILTILLYFSSLDSYLLFHSLAEVFSISIAVTVFILTWNSRSFIKNNYLIMIGIAYLFIAVLDLFHMLGYKGMKVFSDYDYYANQLWIAFRYFESIVLLVSFFMLKSKRTVSVTLLLIIYTIITAGIMLSIFVWKVFPVAFVEGQGQTPFKIISEYVICVILLAAVILSRKYRAEFDKKVYRLIVISLLCTVVTELCFSLYISNYGFSNLVGHYFEIISFYFIYRAIVHTGINEPYNLIFREMKQTEHQLYEQNTVLSNQKVADNLTIQEHIELLSQQYKILNRQAKMLDLSHEAIFAWDLNGPIYYWNKGAELMYGYTSDEAIGQISDALLKTERPVDLVDLQPLLQQRGTWTGEIIHTTKDGRRLSVESAHQLYIDEDGKKAVLEICRDVTERNRLEADLRYRNILLYAVIENMHDALIVYDSDGSISSINARAREMYPGHFTDESNVFNVFQGYKLYDLMRRPIPMEDFPTRRAFRGEAISNERVIIESGKWSRIIEVNATPIVDAQDKILATIVCHHDITELIQKQQSIEENVIQLQQQNKLLNRQSRLLDLSNDAIFAWYMDGPIIYWNQGAQKMYGFSEDDAIGCLPHNLLSSRFPVTYAELKAILAEYGSWSGLIDHTTQDGRLLCIETRLQVIKNELGLNTVLETNRDVTERVKAENEIKKSKIELENIINSTDDFIYSLDADYRIIFFNRSIHDYVLETYGFELAPGLAFLECSPPEAAAIWRELLDRVKAEGSMTIDTRTVRGNRSITYSFHAIYEESELVEITVFARDITERINAEQEIISLNTTLEAKVGERTEQLQQSLETLRNFSMTVTHDLKMPLHQIEKLSRQIQSNTDVAESSAKITSLCSGMNKMISELLDYERITRAEIKKEPVDIGAMIVSVFNELKTDNAVLDFQTGCPRVSADNALLRHVISNIISNSIKFSAGRETIKIVAACKKEDNEYVISMKDNGIGIDMKYAGKLFNAFERLHGTDEFEGQGIGLATVRNIITKHGGRTWLSGKVNVGTTVYFTLPIETEEVSKC